MCVWACIHVYIYIHTYKCVHVGVHVYVCVHIHHNVEADIPQRISQNK